MHQPPIRLKPNVLVAPLDWGLGHATRCIPLIHALITGNCDVIVASSGRTRHLLIEAFPHLHHVHLPGYGIRYSTSALTLPFVLGMQVPKMLKSIRNEHRWLQHLVDTAAIDAVISDNRFGLYHPGIPSVFITHQLRIRTGSAWTDNLLQRLNYRYINRYDACWVPDYPQEPTLSGALSHPARLPEVPVQYIEPLSRFRGPAAPRGDGPLLVILSGPEPQRTLLEEKILRQLETYSRPVTIVRGLPGETTLPATAKHIILHNHLPPQQLEMHIRSAPYVIARCGYSSVMDLLSLKKKCILVPTPGQTEQEYLARHLAKHNLALTVSQEKLKVAAVLDLAATFAYRFPDYATKDGLGHAVNQLLHMIRTKQHASTY